jgi:glycosyltransferase involved in cell wall biosynthesis
MRVAFYGNTCNNQYQIARAIREYSSIDAHLYINIKDDLQTKPESDDPSLAGNYPDWIHLGNYDNAQTLLMPWRSEITRQFSRYDAVVVSGLGPIWAQFCGRPTCFFVTGSDLTIVPFLSDYFDYSHYKLAAIMVSAWQALAMRRMKEFWAPAFEPYVRAFIRLGIKRERIQPVYFPLILDNQRFTYRPQARQKDNPVIRQMVDGHDFVLFHPSRLIINPTPRTKATGQWKQNDLLIKGFASFLQQNGASRSVLVLIDRVYSPDVALARQMIASLGIEKNVLWIKPPRPQGFTRDELIDLYSVSDVAADDFGIGWFGSIVLEASSIGLPVVSYVDEAVMKTLYPWHPVLNAHAPDEIAAVLGRLYQDPTLRAEAGQKGRRWVEEFHSPQKAGLIYVKRFGELADRLGMEVVKKPVIRPGSL